MSIRRDSGRDSAQRESEDLGSCRTNNSQAATVVRTHRVRAAPRVDGKIRLWTREDVAVDVFHANEFGDMSGPVRVEGATDTYWSIRIKTAQRDGILALQESLAACPTRWADSNA